ncbi:hypothetical protein BL254_01845 [Protofrankia sp. BMG5.30]|uniref:Uncharacterized protein n=1 Tax=Protofrankia coriariae TaxID=1562887 RepID=A0ABR5F2P6_9ACTN|nr:hypothetical protein FrCorBMG51_14735 [Protofrankia coriariae]ONH37660.1 hypothetical protein BL254_01845 [Protofrankia sp. BMG5.30]
MRAAGNLRDALNVRDARDARLRAERCGRVPRRPWHNGAARAPSAAATPVRLSLSTGRGPRTRPHAARGPWGRPATTGPTCSNPDPAERGRPVQP